MLSLISAKDFNNKLIESKHYTCGEIDKNEYYKYLDKIYNDYFKKVKRFSTTDIYNRHIHNSCQSSY